MNMQEVINTCKQSKTNIMQETKGKQGSLEDKGSKAWNRKPEEHSEIQHKPIQDFAKSEQIHRV